MKKRNLNSLQLKKHVISTFDISKTGGRFHSNTTCDADYDSCPPECDTTFEKDCTDALQ